MKVPGTAWRTNEWINTWVNMCADGHLVLGPIADDQHARNAYGVSAKHLNNVRRATVSGELRRRAHELGALHAHNGHYGDSMRVVLAEDLALLRDGLTWILRAHDFEVVAAVEDAPSLVAAVVEHVPTSRSSMSGSRPCSPTKDCAPLSRRDAKSPVWAVLVLSQYVEQVYARELMSDQAGGVGYLLKDRVSDVAEFVDSVRRVAAGGTVMDSEVITRLLGRNSLSEPFKR